MIVPILLSCIVTISGKHIVSPGHHNHFGHQGHTHLQSSHINPFIVGGSTAVEGAWPWQVALTSSTGFVFCGGSLTQPNPDGPYVVVTAAHCVDGASNVRIVLGKHSFKDNHLDDVVVVSVNRANIIEHEDYNQGTLNNDIAIIKLSLDSETINRADIGPVSLPENQSDNLPYPCDVTVTGWGTLSSGGRHPNHLQEVTKPYVNDTTCKAAYSGFNSNTMLCAGEEGKDACQGDSGGPLVYSSTPDDKDSYKLYGVVSWGYGCALAGYPGVYAKVSTYVTWIKENSK